MIQLRYYQSVFHYCVLPAIIIILIVYAKPMNDQRLNCGWWNISMGERVNNKQTSERLNYPHQNDTCFNHISPVWSKIHNIYKNKHLQQLCIIQI